MSSREGTFEHAGGRTWCSVAGELGSGRPALLALHGGPGSTHHYFAPLGRLAEAGRAVVLYDQVGCGGSEKRPEVEWSLELFLDEVDALRAELGLERVHLLGTSWGGMLALEHALRRPGTLASLILSSALAFGRRVGGGGAPAARRAPRRGVGRARPARVRRHPRRPRSTESRRWQHSTPGTSTGKSRPELERMKAEKSEVAYRAMVGPNEWTMTGVLKGWDVRSRLPSSMCPRSSSAARRHVQRRNRQDLVDGIRGAEYVVFEEAHTRPCSRRPSATSTSSAAFWTARRVKPRGDRVRVLPSTCTSRRMLPSPGDTRRAGSAHAPPRP